MWPCALALVDPQRGGCVSPCDVSCVLSLDGGPQSLAAGEYTCGM